MSVFRHRFWKVDLKSTNVGLNIQLLTYKRVECPVILRDDSLTNTFLASLKSDVFIGGDLALMAKVASCLESEVDHADRSESIQGSKMNAFGMRWAMGGDTGW